MKHLVIGLGEVGSALREILKCDGFDNRSGGGGEATYDVLHITFPYSDSFILEVKRYIGMWSPSLVIIHSTVPLGTCDPEDWVHSPVRGIHPDLEKGIRTFTKFFGGDRALEASQIFSSLGIKVGTTDKAKDTEALKLWDTTIYGWNILLEKAIKAYCDRNGLDFSTVYTFANATYNDGYALLGHPEYAKYILKDFPGAIGGHCVNENLELLDDPLVELFKDLHSRLSDI